MPGALSSVARVIFATLTVLGPICGAIAMFTGAVLEPSLSCVPYAALACCAAVFQASRPLMYVFNYRIIH